MLVTFTTLTAAGMIAFFVFLVMFLICLYHYDAKEETRAENELNKKTITYLQESYKEQRSSTARVLASYFHLLKKYLIVKAAMFAVNKQLTNEEQQQSASCWKITTDEKGQVVLPEEYARSSFVVTVSSDGETLLFSRVAIIAPTQMESISSSEALTTTVARDESFDDGELFAADQVSPCCTYSE